MKNKLCNICQDLIDNSLNDGVVHIYCQQCHGTFPDPIRPIEEIAKYAWN